MEAEQLRAKAKVLEAEIEQKKVELRDVKSRLAELEWLPISWDELEQLLKREYPGNKYCNNPMVSWRGGERSTYCFIRDDGELQVGPYYRNDEFPRGCDLYIHASRKTWR